MIKKAIVIVSGLLISSVAAALPPQIYTYDHPAHPVKFSMEIKTLNSNINHLDDIDYGYKFQFEYGISKHFYAKLYNIFYDSNRVGYGAKLGYQYGLGRFTPYLELGGEMKPGNNDTLTSYATYDFGLKYDLTHWLTPFVEFDNTAIPGRNSIKGGASVAITPRFSIKADYIQDTGDRNGNGAELEFSYLLN